MGTQCWATAAFQPFFKIVSPFFPPFFRPLPTFLALPSLSTSTSLPPLPCSLSQADSSEVQVLLHETPAVALIEGRYGGTNAAGGRACPLSLLLSTGLTFGNCKLQKLARAKCLTLLDLQPYGVSTPREGNREEEAHTRRKHTEINKQEIKGVEREDGWNGANKSRK